MATLVVDGQRALPARLAGLGFCFAFPDAGAALRDLVAGSAGGSAAKRG
jgi:NAD dependent epimerase/dehydratase family enzyme